MTAEVTSKLEFSKSIKQKLMEKQSNLEEVVPLLQLYAYDHEMIINHQDSITHIRIIPSNQDKLDLSIPI